MSFRPQCSFCPRDFERKSKLFEHANKDHYAIVSSAWIGCDLCNNFFPTSNDLDTHKMSSHIEIMAAYAIQCTFCEKKYNSRQNYYLHVNKSHRELLDQNWFYCERCDNFYPTLEILRNHENHSHDDQKMRTCPFCPKVMTRMSVFYKHANECHKDQLAGSWFSCDTCNNFYPSKFVLDKHKMSTHANVVRTTERLQCDFCPKQLISTYAYYTHANKAHLYLLNGRWFSCDQCHKYFPNKPVLESHKSTVHSRGNMMKKIAEKVTCEFCAQTLRNRAIYYKHVNKVHQQLLIGQWHSCEICQLFFPSLEVLEKHKRQRHNPDGGAGRSAVKIKCKFCPRIFNGNIWYHKHANIAHFNLVVDRWVLCEKCETYVPTEVSLKRHQRKYHSEHVPKVVTRVHCKFCPKMFVSNMIYYLHASRAHRDLVQDKWVLCSTCQRYFPQKKDVETHKCRGPPSEHKADTRSHFVQCGFCNLIENNASGFYRHANKEHRELLAGSNWIQCPACANYYPDKEVLRSHKKHSHDRLNGPKVIKCKYCSKECPDHATYYRHANQAHLMGLIGKWFFCVRCQYFYPNKTVLENHESDEHSDVARVILVHNLPEGGLASIGESSNVTVIKPTEAADAMAVAAANKEKGSKDAIIVLANNPIPKITAASLGLASGEQSSCMFCEKTFGERHHYINHANKTHKEEVADHWIGCEPCNKYFPNEIVLALHNAHHHSKPKEPRYDELSQVAQLEEFDGDTLIKLVCDFCPKSFKHRSYYFQHAQKSHPNEINEHWMLCEQCDKRYPTKGVLASHQARFHRNDLLGLQGISNQYYVVKSETTNPPKKRGKNESYANFGAPGGAGNATGGVAGGAAEDDFWTEMESDIQNFSVVNPHNDQQTMVVVDVGQE